MPPFICLWFNTLPLLMSLIQFGLDKLHNKSALKNLCKLLSFSDKDNAGESRIVKSGQHTLISKQSRILFQMF